MKENEMIPECAECGETEALTESMGGALVKTISRYDHAEQFARDYNWEDTQPRIEDPDHAAAVILSELAEAVAPEVRPHLRAALVASAERENACRVGYAQ